MAEKGFGVKEVNLIGASGTPTITSPNNLNLNANNVAISTNVSIGGTLSVTGNVSVGGTLTYEDVTNIDSVGLITARSGLIISGVTTFNTGDVDFKGSGGTTKILFDASQDQLEFSDSATLTFGNHTGTGDYNISYVNGSDFTILGMNGGSGDLVLGTFASGTTTKTLVSKRSNNALELYFANNKKLETTNTGIDVTGAITVNGSALSITPTNSDIQVVYTVTANGSSAYRFAGNGVVSTADNPDLYLIRGQKYRFINNSGGSHPFQIREASGGTAYSTGVTNNGAASGNIDFAPTYDSPAQLVYQCTSHGGMVGNIYIRGAAGNNTNVGVTTFANKITVESSTNTVANFKGSGGAGFIQITDADDGSLAFIGVDGGAIKLQTSGSSYSDKLIIDSNGKVNIASAVYGGGGTSPELYVIGTSGRQVKIHNSNAGTCGFQLTNSATGEGEDAGIQLAALGGGGGYFKNHLSNANVLDMYSNVSGSQKYIMKIYNDGKIGQQSNTDCLMLSTAQDGSGSNYFLRGSKNSTVPGGGNDVVWIYEDGDLYNANGTYSQSSDISLKENIVDANSQWADIKGLTFRNFNFKASTGLDTHLSLIHI